MNDGFILLQRKITNSWIFQRSDYFHWFTILLLEVNFKDNDKFLFNGKLMPLKRGEFVTSYQKLIYLFPNSSLKKIRNFLRLLIEDDVIIYTNLTKGAKITVLNYDTYQSMGQPKGNQRATKGQPKGNQRATIEERKERKEKKEREEIIKEKFNFRKKIIELGVEEIIADDWMKVRKNKHATNTITAFNSIKKQIKNSGKTPNECIKIAVENDWKGFHSEWLNNKKFKLNNNPNSAYAPNYDMSKDPDRNKF